MSKKKKSRQKPKNPGVKNLSTAKKVENIPKISPKNLEEIIPQKASAPVIAAEEVTPDKQIIPEKPIETKDKKKEIAPIKTTEDPKKFNLTETVEKIKIKMSDLVKNRTFIQFSKGIIKENPSLVGLLGMCPTLAITTMAVNGVGMGLATTFVLICSNVVISLLKNIIPKAVRLPCFIVIIASFVTAVGFILEGYLPDLYSALGLYLALITVNCIILGRAEMFASKNNVLPSLLDGLGMGLGFTLALTLIGSVREILGSGSWFGMEIPVIEPMLIFIMPAGGFFVLGCTIAAVNKFLGRKPPEKLKCRGCPNSTSCESKGECE